MPSARAKAAQSIATTPKRVTHIISAIVLSFDRRNGLYHEGRRSFGYDCWRWRWRWRWHHGQRARAALTSILDVRAALLRVGYSVAVLFTFPLQLYPATKILEARLLPLSSLTHPHVKWRKNAFRGATVNDVLLSLMTVTLRKYYDEIGVPLPVIPRPWPCRGPAVAQPALHEGRLDACGARLMKSARSARRERNSLLSRGTTRRFNESSADDQT